MTLNSREFVTVLADKEIDPFGTTVSEGSPRGVVEEFSIDHRADDDAQMGQAAPAFAIGGHLQAHRGDLVSQPLWSDGRESVRGRRYIQAVGERAITSSASAVVQCNPGTEWVMAR